MGKQTDFTKALDDIHQGLQNEFGVDKENDTIIAQELQDFLNYVVYGYGNWTQSQVTSLSGLLTNTLVAELQEDSNLKELFTTAGGNAAKQGERGEEAFATVILKILQQDIVNLEKAAAVTASKMLQSTNNIRVGKQQSTITLNQEVVNAIQRAETKAIKTVQDQTYTRLYYRQGKNDIDTSSLSVIKGWSPNAQKLIGLTASVKNYQNFTIKLEKLNPQKAYLAIVSNIKNINESATAKLYRDYYLAQKQKQQGDITAHLEHIQSIYALTGYGQIYQSDAINKQIINRYSRFLMYNNPKEKKIIIKSTKDIVSKLISEPTTANNFSISKSGTVRYYLEH